MTSRLNFPFPRLLTIAGSDSGGGAGIQADLKTFSALECFGMSALTAITAQNTHRVTAIHPIPCDVISAQIDAVVSDIGVDAVKVGMLATHEVIATVAHAIRQHKLTRVVVDPVMISKSGDKLLRDDAVEALRTILLPLATVLTPNLPEAEILLGRRISTREDMLEAGHQLLALGAQNVVVKGGHLSESDSPDLFLSRDIPTPHWLTTQRVSSKNTHGTGCTFSSAIAAGLGQGLSPWEATRRAKEYISGSIAGSQEWTLGQGHGPVHHFHRLWRRANHATV